MTDEVFLVQLKSKKSLAKVLSTSKDVVESTGEPLNIMLFVELI
jgi:hypothetical protein